MKWNVSHNNKIFSPSLAFFLLASPGQFFQICALTTKRHRRPKSKWLKISLSHPRILSSHIEWHYLERHFIPYQDEEIEDQGERYSTHFKIKWWALYMAKHMHLRAQMNHLLNVFKKKIIIKLSCSTLFPLLVGTIFLSQLLCKPQLCTASAPSVKSAARPGISSGKQPASAWQMHML